MSEGQGKRGRKAHEPTLKNKQQAESLAGYGLPQDQIAEVLEISETTLKKYYSAELTRGVALANASVAQELHKQCRKGNITALIFWAKTRMGWKESSIHEITGADGQPFASDVSVRFE